MPPAAPAILYTSEADIRLLLSSVGTDMALDDDTSGAVSVTEAAWLTYAPSIGTSAVNRFAQVRYENADLVLSWNVWHWATVLGAEFVWSKRNNPIPVTLQRFAANALATLKKIHDGQESIEDIAQRVTDAISWRNVRHDLLYINTGLRVQQNQSERTPAIYPVHYDRIDQAAGGF